MQCIGGLLWGKCMNKAKVKARLRKLPIEASVAFIVRVGLKVLPWVALSKNKQVLAC